jgi:hypothetical protein
LKWALPSKSHNSNQRQRRERAKNEYADGGYIGADALDRRGRGRGRGRGRERESEREGEGEGIVDKTILIMIFDLIWVKNN